MQNKTIHCAPKVSSPLKSKMQHTTEAGKFEPVFETLIGKLFLSEDNV